MISNKVLKDGLWFEEWGTPRQRADLVRRFLAKIEPVEGSECIEWVGAVDNHGYGVIRSPLNRGGSSKAHRVSYWIIRGPVPRTQHIDHECRYTRCVNPYHLRLMDPSINVAIGNIDRHNTWEDILDDIDLEDIL